ncbi:MAG: choloylglycine hydrolase [Lachnospiraceae bacterium]|nr:choloylglycine hydrolase [Lachnospiraceae bacterium]
MCTAVNFKTKEHYFGRNLDLEYTYQETVTVTPRNYPFRFRTAGEMDSHYAMIGMAYVVDGYPLYYEATNEKGVSAAGLRFAGNAYYPELAQGKDNIPPFEFIPWVLAQCENMQEVRKLLKRVNLVRLSFSKELSLTPLHWMISYKEESLVVESMEDGLHVYENPVNVLTNNPAFPMQLWNLSNYMGLSREKQENRFAPGISLEGCSKGMGAVGLPGDLSSPSRFVRAAFVRNNSESGESEEESVGQFFHILASVEQQKGCVHAGQGKYEITVYSSCCNTDRGIYYYTTYGNRQISAVDMHREDLEGTEVVSYDLVKSEQIFLQNS